MAKKDCITIDALIFLRHAQKYNFDIGHGMQKNRMITDNINLFSPGGAFNS